MLLVSLAFKEPVARLSLSFIKEKKKQSFIKEFMQNPVKSRHVHVHRKIDRNFIHGRLE
jgi:hypothetical protein